MDIEQVIFREISRTVEESGGDWLAPDREMNLMETGLDSLGIAKLVTHLEVILGVDPFSSFEDDISFPVTVGDLVDLYERADKARRPDAD